MTTQKRLLVALVLSVCLISAYWAKGRDQKQQAQPKHSQIPEKILDAESGSLEPKRTEPATPSITLKVPHHLSYPQLVEQIKTWCKEAPDLAEAKPFSQTSKGTDIWTLKLGNRLSKEPKKRVLILSCIHGNETWATGILMAYFGTLLSEYGKEQNATEILNTREIWFVPSASPDSYEKTREVDGVDPNRDFPTPKNKQHQSVAPVMALRKLFFEVRPDALLSGHTYGRLFMTPYGDTRGDCPHQREYDRIVGRMAELAKYKQIHCSELYGRPIFGSELDFFYRNGAFAAVAEFGTHQRIPTYKEIISELDRVDEAITHFLLEAPEVSLNLASEDLDFSENTGIAQSPPPPSP